MARRRKPKRDVWRGPDGKPLEGADAELVTASRLEGDPQELFLRILKGQPVKTKECKVPRAALEPSPPNDAKVVDLTQPETVELFEPGVPPNVEKLETVAASMRAQRLIDRRKRRPASVKGGKAGKGKPKRAHTDLLRRIVADVGPGLDAVLGVLRDRWDTLASNPPPIRIADVDVDDATGTVIFLYDEGRVESVNFAAVARAVKRAAK